jgi:hypothetical protein
MPAMEPSQKQAIHQHATRDLEYLGHLLQEIYPDILDKFDPKQLLEILRESPLKIFENLEH